MNILSMKWKTTQSYSDKQFKRLVGVQRETFTTMLDLLKQSFAQKRKHPKKGRKPKLCLEDQLLMLLMYYREYRTFFHTGSAYGISEGQCWRIITKLETILIQSNLFHLPGKKKLLETNLQWEVVLVDVSESSVERPKKNNGGIIPAKRKSIPSKLK